MQALKKIILKTYQSIFIFSPLILLVPHQYSTDVRQNIVVYLILCIGFLFLPVFILKFTDNFKSSSFKILTTYFLFNLLLLPYSINFSLSVINFVLQISFFIVYSAIKQVSDFKTKIHFLMVLTGVTVLLAIISFYNTVFLQVVNTEIDGASFMWVYYGHNHISAILILTIPVLGFFLKYFWKEKYVRFVCISVLFFLLISLFLTFGRASILALFLMLTIVFWKYKLLPHRGVKTGIILLWGIALILSVNLVYLQIYNYNKSILGTASRLKEMRHGLVNMIGKPFTGTGLGTYRLTKKTEQRFSTNFTHNFIIDSLSDTGLISTSLFIIFLGVLLGQAIRHIKIGILTTNNLFALALLVSVMSLMVNNLVDFDLQLPAIGLLFWIFLGMLNSYIQKYANQLETS